jgi:hypothetical protein
MFRPSMALFTIAEQECYLFQRALQQYCSGYAEPASLGLLGLETACPFFSG